MSADVLRVCVCLWSVPVLSLGVCVRASVWPPHLPVELLLVLHPQVLGERLVLGVQLVEDDLGAERRVRGDVGEPRVLHVGALTRPGSPVTVEEAWEALKSEHWERHDGAQGRCDGRCLNDNNRHRTNRR